MAKRLTNICVFSEIPRLNQIVAERAKNISANVSCLNPKKATGQEPELQNAEIIVTEPHYAPLWLYGLAHLKLVLGTWAGIDSMMHHVRPLQTPQFTYCRFGGEFGQAMSEYVIAQIIAQERNFKLAYKEQAWSCWSAAVQHDMMWTSRSLDRLSIGILGLGDIGKAVSKACKAFGMTVWGMVNTIPAESSSRQHADYYRTSADLEEILANCDYICNILPSTPNTRAMLDSDMLRHCQTRKSVFINVGRGDICSEESILKALNEGWLKAAVLDVFVKEPLDSSSPLWTHPNVTITPHVAAVSVPDLVVDLLMENIKIHIEGREADYKYPIDWQKGY